MQTANYDLWYLLSPTSWPVWLALIAIAFWVRGRRMSALQCFAAASLWSAVISLSPLGIWLIRPLEQHYPTIAPPPAAEYDGIILLGGAEKPAASERSGQAEFNDAAERVTTAFALLQHNPRARLLILGGIWGQAHRVSDVTMDMTLARQLGMPMDRVIPINNTRTTYQNAQRAAPIIGDGHRWLLVTSGFHMPRAMLSFAAFGATPRPYPVDHHVVPVNLPFDLVNFNVVTNLHNIDYASHEWAGLIVYRLLGRTSRLWP